ncbi:MAG: transposase, partial [Burkholderiales bacterium]|nr:transposase [Burkholderiales bacterium]
MRPVPRSCASSPTTSPLHGAEQSGQLPREPAADAAQRDERRRALRRHDWVVYTKTALAGPAAVLDYLSRYTQRTAIGAERLVAIRGEQVLLR